MNSESTRSSSSSWELVRGHPPIARLLAGSGVSSLGDPLTTVASGIAIYSLTRSPIAVAAAFLARAVGGIVTTVALGAAVDRFSRRRMIIVIELGRGTLLCFTPWLVGISPWTLLPVLFLLSAGQAIVQPARQAALSDIVEPPNLTPAFAAFNLLQMGGGIVGYPLAGLVLLWSHNQTTALFLLDGLTFLGSALLSRNLTMGGGGDPELRLHSAYATVLNAPKIWLHLATAAIAAGFVSMTLSTLLLLAYQIGPNGGEAYTILETVLTAGVAAGTWVIGKWRRLPAAVAVTLGLGTMGVMSVLLSLSPNLWLASVILFVASIGNPLYVVGNQKGFLDAVPQSQHGRAMAVRFGVTQVASLTGLAISGPLNAGPGPRTTYFLVALGLIILAVATGIGNRRVRTSANS